jgi:hypothetical protein
MSACRHHRPGTELRIERSGVTRPKQAPPRPGPGAPVLPKHFEVPEGLFDRGLRS